MQSLCGEEKISVRESEDSEGVIPIAELTELLFGVRTVEEDQRGGTCDHH